MFARQPELGEPEKEFLRKVLASYEAITHELGETAEARLLRARGFVSVAHLRGLLGDQPQAEAGYRQAVRLLEQLVADFPDVAEYRQKLAQTHHNLGIVLAELGKQEEAEAAFRQAMALRQRLVEDVPNEPTCRSERRQVFHRLFRHVEPRYAHRHASLPLARHRRREHPGAADNDTDAIRRQAVVVHLPADRERYCLQPASRQVVPSPRGAILRLP